MPLGRLLTIGVAAASGAGAAAGDTRRVAGRVAALGPRYEAGQCANWRDVLVVVQSDLDVDAAHLRFGRVDHASGPEPLATRHLDIAAVEAGRGPVTVAGAHLRQMILGDPVREGLVAEITRVGGTRAGNPDQR